MYQNEATQNLVKSRYKLEDGTPIEMSSGQNEIFDIIAGRQHPRVHAITPTQYGKSLIAALAILTRASTYPEKWAIVAPSNKKAGIIMGYIIDHIFDNPYTTRKFLPDKGETIDKIRRERRKEKINFRISSDDDKKSMLGEIFTLTTEGRRVKDTTEALMGFGAPNVVLDESSLIDDEQYAGVKRMLGGSKDSFLFEIGNPFKRNHFYRTSRDDSYKQVFIDYRQALREGRFSQEFVEEMRKEKLFNILYECQFPDADVLDDKGYSQLITEKEIDRAYTSGLQLFGDLRLGVDVAGGGRNRSVIVVRGENGARVLYHKKTPDTMVLVGEITSIASKLKIKPEDVFVDAIGVGKGLYDRLEEVFRGTNETKVGDKPENPDGEGKDYANLRAQAYWRMADWLKGGGKLERDQAWDQLMDIRYKVQSDRKVRIMPKEEMQKHGIESPDVADALMLTFTTDKKAQAANWKQPAYEPQWEYEGS